MQENATTGSRPARKFTPANIQKIKDWVAQGISREVIAKSLDVSIGSLQVTCSRMGISLRRRDVLNCNAGHLRVMNGNGTRHDIPNQPTIIGHTGDIAQLALAAAVRNVGMTQLLTEIVITAIKKDMLKEILREPCPDPAPQAVPESP